MIGIAKNVISKSNRSDEFLVPPPVWSLKDSPATRVLRSKSKPLAPWLIKDSREIKWRPAPVWAANSNPFAPPMTLAARIATAASEGLALGSALGFAFAFPSFASFFGSEFFGASVLTCKYWQLAPWTHPLGIWKKMQGVLAFSSVVKGVFPLPLPFPLSPLAFGLALGSAAKAGADLSPTDGAAFGGMALAGAPPILGVGFWSLTLGFNAVSMDKAFWSSRSST